MRPKEMNTSLGELMGGAEKSPMKLANLGDILGEKMQEMPRTAVGRFRLVKALQQRYGDGFRNIPGVKGLIKEFDDEIEFDGVLSKMKAIRPKREK
jgi:hypothetical protein